MDMSSACEVPRHGSIDEEDRDHPRFTEYSKYRAEMTRQLVYCPSFKQWVIDQERYALAEAANAHPRIQDYRTWLRENVNCIPSKAEYVDFWTWLTHPA